MHFWKFDLKYPLAIKSGLFIEPPVKLLVKWILIWSTASLYSSSLSDSIIHILSAVYVLWDFLMLVAALMLKSFQRIFNSFIPSTSQLFSSCSCHYYFHLHTSEMTAQMLVTFLLSFQMIFFIPVVFLVTSLLVLSSLKCLACSFSSISFDINNFAFLVSFFLCIHFIMYYFVFLNNADSRKSIAVTNEVCVHTDWRVHYRVYIRERVCWYFSYVFFVFALLTDWWNGRGI